MEPKGISPQRHEAFAYASASAAVQEPPQRPGRLGRPTEAARRSLQRTTVHSRIAALKMQPAHLPIPPRRIADFHSPNVQTECRRPFRLLIVGLGSRTITNLLPAIVSDNGTNLALTAACDTDPTSIAAAQRVLSRSGARPPLIMDRELRSVPFELFDVAIIAAPHDQHRAIAATLDGSTKAVLKEKPLARTTSEASEIFKTDLSIRTLTDRPYTTEALLALSLLTDLGPAERLVAHSALPSPHYINTWRNDPVRAGGGVLLDLGYHLVDLTTRLLGPADWVAAREGQQRRPGYLVEEDVDLFLMTAQGTARLTATRLASTRHERFFVASRGGSVSWTKGRVNLTRPGGYEHTWLLKDEPQHHIRRMLIQESTLALSKACDVDHSFTVQRTIDALYRSLSTGTAIEIPSRPDWSANGR